MSFLLRSSFSLARYPFRNTARGLFTIVGGATEYAEKKNNLQTDRVTVLQLSASWCGPCRKIKPEIQAMSLKYPDVDFLYIDIEAIEDAAEDHSVTALPTFIFMKGNRQVGRVEGAQKNQVETQLKSALESK